MNTINNTNWVKGICILVVIVHHYKINYPIPGNQFVALFFLLSGYGLYYSFNKIPLPFTQKNLLIFFIKRFIRIYPLWWTAMAVAFILGVYTCSPYEFIKDFFLVRMLHSHIWFLNAILQCYVMSPLLYLVIVKYKWYSIVIFTAAMIVLMPVCDTVLELPNVATYSYRSIYFLHVYLFAMGMILPTLKTKCTSSFFVLVLVWLLFFAACDTTGAREFFQVPEYFVRIVYFQFNVYIVMFISTALVLTWYTASYSKRLPLQSFFIFLGKASLPLYLFHGYYFKMILPFERLANNEYIKFCIFAFFLPFFSFVCLKSQIYLSILVTSVANKFFDE